jgi:hypothetical protein
VDDFLTTEYMTIILPQELWGRIFEYDSTYHEIHRQMMDQIRRFHYLITTFRLLDVYPDGRLSHRIKAVARSTKKHELKSLSVFLRLSIPRKITKYRLSLRLFTHMLGVSFSFVNKQGHCVVQPHNKLGERFI